MKSITVSPIDRSARNLVLAHFAEAVENGRATAFDINADGTIELQGASRRVVAPLKAMGLVEIVSR